MSEYRDKDRTGLFTVVGAPYVPEQHSDARGHYHRTSEQVPKSPSIAGLWLIFYALIIGIAVFGKSGAGSAIETARSYFR
jgi:hypothetical protein